MTVSFPPRPAFLGHTTLPTPTRASDRQPFQDFYGFAARLFPASRPIWAVRFSITAATGSGSEMKARCRAFGIRVGGQVGGGISLSGPGQQGVTVEEDHTVDPAGPAAQRRLCDDRGTTGVADDHRLLQVQRVDEAEQLNRHVGRGVGRLALAVA